MAARILAIGTAVPATTLPQDAVRDLFARQPGVDRLTRRLIHAAFDAAAIDLRHTVLTALGDALTADGHPAVDAPEDPRFVSDAGALLAPTTGARNALYARVAPALFAEAARAALSEADLPASEVTHVVTVSCTGFFAPGPDYRLVRDLGLPTTVPRYHLGFIGCAAALPALRLATQICAAEPDAVVLVVCVELCSLHLRVSADPQQIVAASVFADGAAAAVVSADPARAAGPTLELGRFGTALTEDGEQDMVWTIGDRGFEMTLSAEVPRIIGREIHRALDGFLDGEPAPSAWAVHPGGRAVLDRVESGLELEPAALRHSRDVLREYGNMSSATVLFILRRHLHDADIEDGCRVGALAFGPGLTVESALLTKRTAVRGPASGARADELAVRG